MKFNGDVWLTIPNTQQLKDEPVEFVIVKNAKNVGGIIPYAKWKNGEWSATPIPNRVLIRELALALESSLNLLKDEVEKPDANPFAVKAFECKCGDVKFGNREFVEKAGWDFDKSVCARCLKKSKESKK